MQFILLVGLFMGQTSTESPEAWKTAEENAKQTQRVVQFCDHFVHGWLSHVDARSGLFPRNLRSDFFWNAKDCAADNYPFMVLTSQMTDDYYLKQAMRTMLDQEQKLANRLDSLPDDFDLATQRHRTDKYDLASVIFGAAEYCKDGLIPITEWLGPSPWLVRMEGLVRDIWKHAAVESKAGKIPSDNIEVNGDLLQTMSRLYWMTGNDSYKEWTFRLADHYLIQQPLVNEKALRLRDHGCEIVGGLSEACVIASREDQQRWQQYRPAMRAVLDAILEHGVNPDGMMYDAFNPKTGEVVAKRLSDGWGYVYNAFLTFGTIDNEKRYLDAVARALANIHKYQDETWGPGKADEYADTIEGAINLLNRVPVESGFKWVEESVARLLALQRDDGIIEGWHGDGNSARTAWMYALWKTQGITLAPWREDMQLGAVRGADGTVRVLVKCDWPWSGRVRFDRPRHAEFLHMPTDYPRINQFPEWFTAASQRKYVLQVGGQDPKTLTGRELHDYPLSLKSGDSVRLTLRPADDAAAAKMRTMRYSHRSATEAAAWQKDLRTRLLALLKLDDLRSQKIPLDPKPLASEDKGSYTLQEMEINSTPGRRILTLLTLPREKQGRLPAVVCIHGHGGSRRIVYDRSSIYRGFAAALADAGCVTVATDVGQHEVREKGRTLMGERLWDLMRCVDYLSSLPEVDASRIGCAGLSLGGEMAMWLGAMDERIAATVSSGFLTTMDQMEQDHCMCWKFDGLRELVDYADIYSLIAPRYLQCQNGLAEPSNAFIVPLARQSMREISLIYADLGKPDNVALDIHPEAHVIDLPALTSFLSRHLIVAGPRAKL